jgi:sterol desaturase/sphingolipid hydroxylase (fatty acid hydroxylase superfamily)
MNTSTLASINEHYHWLLSLYVIAGILVLSLLGRLVVVSIPTLRESGALNRETARNKMLQESYARNQRWNLRWAVVSPLVIFALILPFCLTLESQPWWKIPLDAVVILMFYDFVYYLVHRFLFHGRALAWCHALHHQQRNPCRQDSSYIHPLEVAIGMGLLAGSIFVLARLMGEFHVVTIAVTWIAFSGINVHNHALWKADRFPYRYLNYVSKMHHHHHARFSSGNFATISLLYDWLFGTYDTGDGYRNRRAPEV